MTQLTEYIEHLPEGHLDSQGQFTVAPDVALAKLRVTASKQAWMLLLVQAAVQLGASRVDLKALSQRQSARVVFPRGHSLTELLDAAGAEPGTRELGLSLRWALSVSSTATATFGGGNHSLGDRQARDGRLAHV